MANDLTNFVKTFDSKSIFDQVKDSALAWNH